MAKRIWLVLAVAALIGGSAAAQNNGAAVLQAAAAKMGVTNMKSIQYTGAGWQGMVGQNFNPGVDWPRVDLKDYTRTIDFDTMSSKEEYTRSQGNNSLQGGGAGFPFLQDQKVVNFVSGNYAWTQNAQGQMVPQPDQAEQRRLEIYLTPAWIPEGCNGARREPDFCHPQRIWRARHRGLLHGRRKVSRQRHDQRGQSGPAGPDLGSQSRRRRPLCRVRLHPISRRRRRDVASLPQSRGLRRRRPSAQSERRRSRLRSRDHHCGAHQRAQCRAHCSGQRQDRDRPARARRVTDVGTRPVADRRRLAQQRAHRVPGLRGRHRGAVERGAVAWP